MLAQEYLEDMQAVYVQYNYLVEILHMRREMLIGTKGGEPSGNDDIPRYYRQLATATVDKLWKDLPQDFRDSLEADLAEKLAGNREHIGWGQRAHTDFLNHTSEMAREVLMREHDIAVGMLQTASFNASAIPVPGQENSFVIALNEGVSLIVYEVARTIAATYKVHMGEAIGIRTLSVQEAGQIIYGRLNYYIHLGVPYGGEYDVSHSNIVLASTLTTMAERFVYAHEISHIILGHHTGAFLQALPGDWTAVRQTVQSFDQECAADILAWQLLVHIYGRSIADLQMAYAGVSLFLRVADILERAEDLTAVGTHPPALERLAYIHKAARQTTEDAKVTFEQVSMIERAMSDGLKHVMKEVPLLPGCCPLEELLDKCSSSAIPDYMMFQDEILHILSLAAPSKLCCALGRALGKAEIEFGQLDILTNGAAKGIDNSSRSDILRAAQQSFNKLKLVGGLLGFYLIPEIGRFIERARDKYISENNNE